MGRVVVKMKLTNDYDWARAQAGELKAGQVRNVDIEGLVHTGATMLMLPARVARELGLPFVRKARVTYADGRQGERDVASGIIIRIFGREARVEALVEPRASRALIGQIPLEALDLIVDPKSGALGPRPESPDAPLMEAYLLA